MNKRVIITILMVAILVAVMVRHFVRLPKIKVNKVDWDSRTADFTMSAGGLKLTEVLGETLGKSNGNYHMRSFSQDGKLILSIEGGGNVIKQVTIDFDKREVASFEGGNPTSFIDHNFKLS